MMKKIFCLLFALLILFSCVIPIAGADATDQSLVMRDLETLYIDGVKFLASDEKWKVDKTDDNVYVMAVTEIGFKSTTSSDGYKLRLYVYNPSLISIQDVNINKVKMGLNDQCTEFDYWCIDLVSASKDNRFLRFDVITVTGFNRLSDCYMNQESVLERVYNIVDLQLMVDDRLKPFKIDQAFCFTGYDYNKTLACSAKKLGSVDVVLYDTNWISPNAGIKTDGSEATIYDHYEINSVYFRVPKSYFDDYGNLKSIRAIYDALRLTPIILTREGGIDFNDEEGEVTKKAIDDGITIEPGTDTEVYDLCCEINDKDSERWLYSDSAYLHSLYAMQDYPYRKLTSLAYYFECLPEKFDYDDGEILKAVVSSEELEQYFLERYNDPYYDNNKLYSEIRAQLVIDYNSRDYDGKALWNMTTFDEALKDKGLLDRWWTKLTTEKDAYTWDDFNTEAEHIKVITDPSAYVGVGSTDASSEAVANELFIGFNDVEDFGKVCATAAANDEYIVLLRFGFSDYRCAPVTDKREFLAGLDGPTVALGVEKWAYMNISVAHLVFCDSGKQVTVPVSSSIVNSFGDLDAAGDPSLDVDDITDTLRDKYGDRLAELWENIKTVLLILAICAVVVFVIWIVLRLKPQKVKIDYGDHHKRE